MLKNRSPYGQKSRLRGELFSKSREYKSRSDCWLLLVRLAFTRFHFQASSLESTKMIFLDISRPRSRRQKTHAA